MSRTEPYGHGGRLLVAIVLVVALGGLLVWYGAVLTDPVRDQLPTEEEFGPDSADYVGDRVAATGTIVETNPVVIQVTYGDDSSATFVLEGYEEPVSAGDYELVVGTLVDESRIDVVEDGTTEPWETAYMYGVSLLAVGWIVVRFCRQWRFDRGQLAFVPRATRATAQTQEQPSRETSTGDDPDPTRERDATDQPDARGTTTDLTDDRDATDPPDA